MKSIWLIGLACVLTLPVLAQEQQSPFTDIPPDNMPGLAIRDTSVQVPAGPTLPIIVCFKDVPPDHWAADAVAKCFAYGILIGDRPRMTGPVGPIGPQGPPRR